MDRVKCKLRTSKCRNLTNHNHQQLLLTTEVNLDSGTKRDEELQKFLNKEKRPCSSLLTFTKYWNMCKIFCLIESFMRASLLFATPTGGGGPLRGRTCRDSIKGPAHHINCTGSAGNLVQGRSFRKVKISLFLEKLSHGFEKSKQLLKIRPGRPVSTASRRKKLTFGEKKNE